MEGRGLIFGSFLEDIAIVLFKIPALHMYGGKINKTCFFLHTLFIIGQSFKKDSNTQTHYSHNKLTCLMGFMNKF